MVSERGERMNASFRMNVSCVCARVLNPSEQFMRSLFSARVLPGGSPCGYVESRKASRVWMIHSMNLFGIGD
jgi:hypothetical protein